MRFNSASINSGAPINGDLGESGATFSGQALEIVVSLAGGVMQAQGTEVAPAADPDDPIEEVLKRRDQLADEELLRRDDEDVLELILSITERIEGEVWN